MNKNNFILLLLFITFAVSSCNNTKKTKVSETIKKEEVKPIPEPEKMFGLPIDSFIIKNGKVKPNEMMSKILGNYEIPYSTIDKLVNKSKPIFDVRKINAGKKYYLFFSNDSLYTPKYFVYEINKIDYIVYDLTDTLNVYKGKRKVKTLEKKAGAAITKSLWMTFYDNNINTELSGRLEDIFGWTVDFFGIGKNDFIKVIYNENYVDSTSVGIGEIKAALFHHQGKNYYAFNFQEDSVTRNFFNEKGQSLRKAFLKAPLKFSRISSHFSNSRLHPVLKIRRPHHGVDYAAPTGTPIHTIGDGKIIARGYQARGGGNYLKIKHNSVYTTLYMHMSKFAKGMTIGTHVKQGQTIGYVGATGLATGPHLDFRVFKNRVAINPLKVKAPPVSPVKKEDMSRYKKFYKPLKKKLDNIKI